MTCGPCRRPRRDGSLVWFHPELDIPQLNQSLPHNSSLRHDLASALAQVWVEVENATQGILGLRIAISPELEDNYDEWAFGAVKPLFEGNSFQPFRNKLGDQDYDLEGWIKEQHGYGVNDLMLLSPGDILNGDGADFALPGEKGMPNVADIQALAKAAQERGVHFLLWRPEWQGLPQGGPPGGRTYRFEQVEILKEIMNG